MRALIRRCCTWWRKVRRPADESNFQRMFEVALHDLSAMRWSSAARLFNDLVVMFPDSDLGPALTNLATAEMRCGNLGRAHIIAQRAARQLPPDSDALMSVAIVELECGFPDLAEPLLVSILSSKPDHAGALALMAQARERVGDTTGVLEYSERAIAAEGAFDAALWCARARALAIVGRTGDALAALEEAVQRAVASPPAVAQVHHPLALLLQELGFIHADNADGPHDAPHAELAVEALEKAVSLDPSMAEAWDRLARIQLHAGEFEAAEAASRNALRLWLRAGPGARRKSLEAMQMLAAALSNLEEGEEAEQILLRAIAAAESIGEPAAGLQTERAIVLAKLKRYAEVIELVDREIENGHDSTVLRNTRAGAHLELGDIDQAKSDLQFAAALAPGDATVQANVAYLMWVHASEPEDRSDALQRFRRAMTLRPEQPEMWARFCAVARVEGRRALCDEYGRLAVRLFEGEWADFAADFESHVTELSSALSGETAGADSEAETEAERDDPKMPKRVDYALISILEEEFEAVLRRFPPLRTVRGKSGRRYNLCQITDVGGAARMVVTVRAGEPGNSEAQEVVRDLIEEVQPRCVALVGVAGARPADEYTLGDVVVSNAVADFRMEALLADGTRELNVTGSRVDPEVWGTLANLPAERDRLGPWSDPESVGRPRPGLEFEESRLTGDDDEWRADTRASLLRHFGEGGDREPLVRVGPIGSSDRLVKDPRFLGQLLKNNRKLLAIEMEFAGAHYAARNKSVPVFTVRGISDIVGYKRSADWLLYACDSAASFALAVVRAEILRLE